MPGYHKAIAAAFLGLQIVCAPVAGADERLVAEAELKEFAADKSAMVVMVEGVTEAQNLALETAQQKIDSTNLSPGIPFVKQYVLTPGLYKVFASGNEQPIVFEAEPNRVTILKYVSLSPAGSGLKLENARFNLSIEEAKKLSEVIGFWYPGYATLGAEDLSAAKAEHFYLSVRPIGPLPPDPDDENDKKPKQ